MQERIDVIRKELEAELTDLLHELEVDLPIRIDEARSKGDLSENAEYSAAKERQRYVSARMVMLQNRLTKIGSIDLSQVDHDSIGLYSTVELLETESGREYTYELVIPEEMDVKKGMISIASPIGQQLRGKKAGKKVKLTTPARTFTVKVKRFTNIAGKDFEG